MGQVAAVLIILLVINALILFEILRHKRNGGPIWMLDGAATGDYRIFLAGGCVLARIPAGFIVTQTNDGGTVATSANVQGCEIFLYTSGFHRGLAEDNPVTSSIEDWAESHNTETRNAGTLVWANREETIESCTENVILDKCVVGVDRFVVSLTLVTNRKVASERTRQKTKRSVIRIVESLVASSTARSVTYRGEQKCFSIDTVNAITRPSLDKQTQEFLTKWSENAKHLAGEYLSDQIAGKLDPVALDAIVGLHTNPNAESTTPEDHLVNALGAQFANYCSEQLDLKWRRLFASDGNRVVLTHPELGVTVDPFEIAMEVLAQASLTTFASAYASLDVLCSMEKNALVSS